MNSNPPPYVQIRPIIKHCQGCRVLFDKSEHIPPNNLVFRYVMRREYPDKDNPGQWKVGDKPRNAYFHSWDLACLKRISELLNVNETHIYIEDGIYHNLTEKHLELLDRCGHLVPLRKTFGKIESKEIIWNTNTVFAWTDHETINWHSLYFILNLWLCLTLKFYFILFLFIWIIFISFQINWLLYFGSGLCWLCWEL